MKRLHARVYCSLCLLLASRAAAHAPPEASDVRWIGPSGAERALVRTNRGLIFEGNQPHSFSIACNDSFFVGLSEMPPIASLDDGRLLIGTYQAGLVLSSQDYCDYSVVGGPIEGINTIDVKRGPSGTYYAAVLPLDGSAAQLFESSDGQTFGAAAVLASVPNAIALAAADANRVYVSATVAQDDKNAAQLLVSTDAGQSFAQHAITLAAGELRAFVRAVDPSDPDRVFVRTESQDGVSPERLLLSEDGGESFQTVLSAGGPIVVAAASDAVWAGTAEGLYRSTDRGRSFAAFGPAFITHIGCVGLHGSVVYTCGYSESQLMFGVFSSSDGGATFTWFLQFPEVAARIACMPHSLEGVACANAFYDWSAEQGLSASNPSSTSTGGMSSATAGASALPAGLAGSAGSQARPLDHGPACSLASPASRSPSWQQGFGILVAMAAYRRRRRARNPPRVGEQPQSQRAASVSCPGRHS